MRNGFGVYFDPTKKTSGQRFFFGLCQTLAGKTVPLENRPRAILFNVSASLEEIVKAKLRGQKVVLRVDGLYFDRLSPAFLATFRWPLREILALGLRYPMSHDFFAFWANLISRNYGSFVRIFLADHIIYQSKFSQQVYRRYFPGKPWNIIVNGSKPEYGEENRNEPTRNDEIQLVTIFDEFRPSKRIADIVFFVQWARNIKNIPLRLTILGYTEKFPDCVPAEVKTMIEKSTSIRSLPQFEKFDGPFRAVLHESDSYLTFTYRDACPNTVVESMAHGLPVVGIASGGVPDIVGDAGALMPMDDFSSGFYSGHRYECDFPPIDFEQVLELIMKVVGNLAEYRERVRRRFIDDLSIEVVAERYAEVMRSLV